MMILLFLTVAVVLNESVEAQTRRVQEAPLLHGGRGDVQSPFIGKPEPKNGKKYFSWSRPIRQFLNPSDTAWFANMRKVATANGVTETTMKAVNDG